jgi:hypothetical protein
VLLLVYKQKQGEKMSNSNEPKVGDTITTRKNKFVGVVQEVKQNATGSYKVKLLLSDGTIHYTTVL